MHQFYIVEILKTSNGEYAHNIYYEYDEDATKAQNKGESKYYSLLSSAAISEFSSHSVILFNTEGVPLIHYCYKH